MKVLSREEIKELTSEFAYSDHKTGVVGGYCEEGFPFYYANDNFVKMLGYDSLDALVKAIDGKVVNTIHPDDLEQVSRDLGGSYYEGLTYATTYRMPRKDGTWFWTVDKGKIIKTDDNRLAIISVCFDMSDFIEKYKELEDKRVVSDYLFKNLPGGYHRCANDEGYTFLYVSERFLNLLGWTKEEIETKFDNKFINLLHPDDRKFTDNYVERIVNNALDNPYQEAIYRLECKDGYRWFSDTTMKATVGNESFFQGFITDISSAINEKEQKYDLINSFGEIFEEVCQIDVKNKKYLMLSGIHEGKTGDYDALKNYVQRTKFTETSKELFLELINPAFIQTCFKYKKKHSCDIRTIKGDWYTVSAIVQKRDKDDGVTQILLTSQNVTEQKKKELEYQGNLEEGLFAIADGFCKINLTKNFVPDVMYHVVNGVRYNVNDLLGIKENAPFDVLVKEMAKNIPNEYVEQFYEDMDRHTLLKRFKNGETQISFFYWINIESRLMLAEQHMELYSDSFTGDVIAINYVIDRTEQYRLQEQKLQSEEKTRELEKLLQMEKDYSAILPVLRGVYDQIFSIDLQSDTYYRIQASADHNNYGEPSGKARGTFDNIIRRFVNDNYIQTLLKFIDFDTIANRLSKIDNIFAEYMDKYGNWRSSSFLVQERNELGVPTKLLFTIRNINKQKEEEQEQQKLTELRLQTVTEAIHGGFKISKNDPNFTFIMVSEQLAKMLGYDSSEEMMEASGGCMTGIADNEIAHSQIPQVLKSVEAGEMYTMNYRVRCKDGSWKNIEDRGRLIKNEKGDEEYWSFIVDKDEMVKTAEALEAIKAAYKELDEARSELKTARDRADEANEAKSQFLFSMSHDIRTPMNAILGYARLMKNDIKDPKLLDYQEKIEQSGNLLLAIINNVLDMARIESGKMELDESYLCIPDAINETYNSFVAEANKKGIEFTCDVDLIHKHVICDPTKTKQINLNLISNAIKYTPEGKSVKAKISELPCDEDGYVLIKNEVIDTGIGMSKEFLPHIFDTFERERNSTTSRISGTGLGMSIVKRLVDLMGGTIEVESELGKGSKFTVVLKHKIADSQYYEKNIDASSVNIGEGELNGKHVLLAEDNDLNAEIAEILLSNLGLIVDRVEDGVKCVTTIENSPSGTYDLILMDIQMPNMDGYKATKIIRRLQDKQKANIPIVAMTANAFEKDRQDAFNAGMNGHIAKPVNIENLKKVILEQIKNK